MAEALALPAGPSSLREYRCHLQEWQPFPGTASKERYLGHCGHFIIVKTSHGLLLSPLSLNLFSNPSRIDRMLIGISLHRTPTAL